MTASHDSALALTVTSSHTSALAATADIPAPQTARIARPWHATEDIWAILIGLGFVAAAVIAVLSGSSIKWLTVIPAKWSSPDLALQQAAAALPRYLALFAVFGALLALGARSLGYAPGRFLAAFAAIFAVSALVIWAGAWVQADRYNLEPPLVALGLGLLIANTVGVPGWLKDGLRVEYYVKTGIVLLGATLPLTLILSAGPVAIGQAAVVSLATFGVIYFVARRLGLDERFAATLGAGGAVCGVSASIAVAGAVGARREHGPIAISIVVLWAIVMIFVLPLVARALGLPTGVAGAWIGTSEFADAAGFAAAQAYGGYAGQVPGIAGSPDDAVNAFTLMKVIGRDLWVGIWAFALSLVAVTRWESGAGRQRVSASEIWHRFPKFVVGFALTSLIIAAVTTAFAGPAVNQIIKPDLIAPLKNLRVWAFTFCFLSIGLSTRWRDLAQAGSRPFIAFSAGVAVNLVLGFVLSVVVFGGYWAGLGH